MKLAVSEADSLAAKVETLRVFLEQELGLEQFMGLYHHLESLSPKCDRDAAAARVCELVGEERVHFVPLVHQLIAAEEMMHSSV